MELFFKHPESKIESKVLIAYASNSGSIGKTTDRKQIDIPDNCSYYHHTIGETTANPQDGKEKYWTYRDGVIRNSQQDKIIAVWVEVEAWSRDTFGPRVWIGAALTVTWERH